MPPHHRHLVALENTAKVHNVICCTLCSCTAFTIIGLPPDWYKDLDYRARVVRQSRTVLSEMGLDLPPEMEIRVWDTTASKYCAKFLTYLEHEERAVPRLRLQAAS